MMCNFHDVNIHCKNWVKRDRSGCQRILWRAEHVHISCEDIIEHQNTLRDGRNPEPLGIKCISPAKSDEDLDWENEFNLCADCLKARQSAERPGPSDGGGKREDGDNDDPDDTTKSKTKKPSSKTSKNGKKGDESSSTTTVRRSNRQIPKK